MKKHYIGIDLGGTHIKGVLLDPSLKIVEQYSVDTEDNAQRTAIWKDKIKSFVDNMKMKYSSEITCGIAAPGLANNDNSMIQWMPGRMNGLENFEWNELLGMPLCVINDAHAACIAEWKLGAAKDKQHVLMITLGTGVGGAAILNGSLYQGAMGRAGHFGHITLDYNGMVTSTNMVGSLEQAIGNLSVKDRTFGKYDDTEKLVKAFRLGDVKATYWWLDSINKLACGLSSLINCFDPEMIVIGGGIANANESLFDPLKEFISLYEWQPGQHPTLIKKAELGEYAGAIGAALFTELKTNHFHGTNA